MTITAPAAGDDILDTWTQAVTNQLNGLGFTTIQAGTFTVTFTSATNNSTAVTFATPFTSAPTHVSVNIATTSGVTQAWAARAVSITSTGFTAFFITWSTAQAWSSVPCTYVAVI